METEETVKEECVAMSKTKRIWLAFVDIVLFTVLFMIFLFLATLARMMTLSFIGKAVIKSWLLVQIQLVAIWWTLHSVSISHFMHNHLYILLQQYLTLISFLYPVSQQLK